MPPTTALKAAFDAAPPAPLTPKACRQILRVSIMAVAVRAGVGMQLVRFYEIDPEAVVDRQKRRALRDVYAGLRAKVLEPLHDLGAT